MAEKIVSAGVFTREKDLSFIAQGVSEIGASIIGPTEKGPALVPLQINGINDFYSKYGPSSLNSYVARTIEAYMANSSVANVVRVLGADTWNTTLWTVIGSGSGLTSGTVAAFAPTVNGSGVIAVTISGSTNGNFVVHDGTTSYSCSFNITSPNYISKVFGTDPLGATKIYLAFNNSKLANSFTASAGSAVGGTVGGYAYATPAGYSRATTPWIQSQTIAGNKNNLFRFHTISDGDIANKEVKVGVQDIKAGTAGTNYYGSFTLVVRNANGTFGSQDLDRRAEVVETFSNLTLDPNSTNYVAKRLGDKFKVNTVVNGANRIIESGSYNNKSKYIRVEMASGVATLTPYAVPYGFAAVVQPVPTTITWQAATMVLTQSIDGAYDSRRFYGFDYEYADNLNYLTSKPGATSGVGSNASFSLDDITVPASLTGAPYNGSLANVTGSSYVAQRKFMVPFQGGFDGMVPTQSRATGEDITATNIFGFNCNTSATAGTLQYKKALDAIASAEEVDTNLVVVPGILYSLHTEVALYAKNICETRGDCFYIMDAFELTDTVLGAVNVLVESPGELDSNYVAVYYPWVKVVESSTNNQMWVPPSVVMPAVFAFNDRVSYEWFAPAGLNRGGLTDVIDARTRLNHAERDDLYEARINPIATFPGQGVVVWGQKTLQIKPSALDRINVRRLLINLKKFVASTSRYLVFEQNTTATRNRFLNIVNPYMASVQQKSGLYAFKVIMDETNNTPDVIDRNMLYGQIYLQPTRTAEFIVIDFNILPSGATFPTA
jgi:hypothetical protein